MSKLIFSLVPTVPRGNPYPSLYNLRMHSHAGAWERGKALSDIHDET